MVKQYKVDEVASLKSKLEKRKNFFFTNYSGVKVKDLSELRRLLRTKDAEYKVVKNTLFRRALKELGYEGMDNYVVGPLGVAFMNDEVGEIAKLLRDFGKEREKFSVTIGVIDKVLYSEAQVKTLADLPSREVLLSQIMMMINAPTTRVATGMNQIMASLARGIKAVAEKNAGA